MTIVDETEMHMQQTVDYLCSELNNLRTQRPNPSILDSVIVEVYGTEMRVRDLAAVSTGDGRQLLITPFDPQTTGPIVKGIERANLGLKPIAERAGLRVPIPPMSEEMRRRMVKEARDRSEQGKVAIREHRRKANDFLKNQKLKSEISEDEQKKMEKLVQTLTDRFCKRVDSLCEQKEKDILEI